MLRTIARHEWRILLSEKTLGLIAALLGLSIAYGVFNGVGWTEFQRNTIRNAMAEEAGRLRDLKNQVNDIEAGRQKAPTLDPRAPDTAGGRLAWRYAAMPPAPLAALSVGQSDVLPYYFRVSTASKESILTTNEIENPHRLLSGRFDLSFVIVYLFPLLILALSYNLISLEKEQGTLALLLSQPVALRTFMAAKIGLRAALFVALVLVFSLSGIVAGGVSVTSGNAIVRLAVWSGIVAAYAAFWFGVALWVTSFGKTSGMNAVALAGIWLVFVVVLPSALNLAAAAMYPMPSRVELIAALRSASNEASAKSNELLGRYYLDHPDLVAISDVEKVQNDVAIARLAMDEDIELKVRPVVDRYETQLALQQSLVDRLGLFSPAIVAQDAINAVAGTGITRYRHFLSLVDDYHRQWRAFFLPMIVKKQRLTPAMYDQLPGFEYREEGLGLVMYRAGTAMAGLIAAALVIGGLGAGRLRKYPIANKVTVMRLLLVEDDPAIRGFLQRALSEAGYQGDAAENAATAERLAIGGTHDAFVIDLGLPDGDGLDLIQRCRAQGSSAPVLILSARRSVNERVQGLERGGDDYLTKPFALAELLARLRNLLRRAAPLPAESARLRVGTLHLDLVRREAFRSGQPLRLTPQEFILLEYLCRNAGRVVTRTMLLDQVWRMRIDPATNVVDVHIYRLRNKVDRDADQPLIHTIRGVGYVLKDF